MLPILIKLVSEDYTNVLLLSEDSFEMVECKLKNDKSAAPVDEAKSIVNIYWHGNTE